MSRYPKVGSITMVWGYDGQEAEHAVVLGTSRHRRSVSTAEALQIGRDAFGPQVKLGDGDRWRSVTAACPDDVGEADVGGWSSDGDGAAWVDVVLLRCTDPVPAQTPREGGD